MSRAKRRQYAILGVLHEYGPQPALGLCKVLGRGPGTIYPDLAALERECFVVSEWEDDFLARTAQAMPIQSALNAPRRRIYRLANEDERRQKRRISLQVEQEIGDRVAARSRPQRPWRSARPEGA